MRDPYDVLGIARTASDAEIKTAYRRLAKSLHPDLQPGAPDAEARFQELQGAYRLLKDPALRRRYDRGFVDPNGNPQPSPFEEALREAARQEALRERGQKHWAGGTHREDVMSDLLANLRRGRKGHFKMGETIPLTISFAEAIRGARRTVGLPSGSVVALTIPPGTETGQTLRLRNVNPKAEAGEGKPPVSAQLAVEITVIADDRFTRDGLDILCTVPISLPEAVLGAQIHIPVPGGTVKLTVPPGSNTGTVLKLKGQGVRRIDGESGNLKVELRVVLPDEIDPELEAIIKGWAKSHAYDVRPLPAASTGPVS